MMRIEIKLKPGERSKITPKMLSMGLQARAMSGLVGKVKNELKGDVLTINFEFSPLINRLKGFAPNKSVLTSQVYASVKRDLDKAKVGYESILVEE